MRHIRRHLPRKGAACARGLLRTVRLAAQRTGERRHCRQYAGQKDRLLQKHGAGERGLFGRGTRSSSRLRHRDRTRQIFHLRFQQRRQRAARRLLRQIRQDGDRPQRQHRQRRHHQELAHRARPYLPVLRGQRSGRRTHQLLHHFQRGKRRAKGVSGLPRRIRHRLHGGQQAHRSARQVRAQTPCDGEKGQLRHLRERILRAGRGGRGIRPRRGTRRDGHRHPRRQHPLPQVRHPGRQALHLRVRLSCKKRFRHRRREPASPCAKAPSR